MVFRRTIILTIVLFTGLAVKTQAAELITNGSFETGNFTGWTIVNAPSPWFTWATVGSGFNTGFLTPTSPQHGSFVAFQGVASDPGTFSLTQQVTIPAGTAALFWKHRFQMDLATFCTGGGCGTATFRVDVLNTSNVLLSNLFITTVSAGQIFNSGWQNGARNMNSFAGQTVRIRFSTTVTASFAGPGQLEIDQVSLQAPFVVTSAPATISGRVTDPFGRPVNSAIISLTDQAGRTRTATTNTFGYYKIDDLPVGNLYVIAVRHRRYQFSESSRVVNLLDSVADLNFVAERN